MKRAPIIPKNIPSASASAPTATVPAAPMVDSLIARVGAMAKGNTILLPVCGREIKFTLETISADSIERQTRVWGKNERDQTLLTEDSLDDLIPSFLLTGQQTPAFGRSVDGIIEIADGSRRRMTAIFTHNDYRVLVGDLDDEQMDSLCKLGNDYRPTSAYERGKRYSLRLQDEFKGNISALADAENISRKVINRCIYTSQLPHDVLALFSHPGELSARAGEKLYRTFADKEHILVEQARKLSEQKKAGVIFEAEEIIQFFNDALKAPSSVGNKSSTKTEFVPGAFAQYKNNRVIFNLDLSRIPPESIEKIEKILRDLKH